MSEEEEKVEQSQTEGENTVNNLITVRFTPEELQALIGLLDIAVRARGLDVAGNAVVIHRKIITSSKINY